MSTYAVLNTLYITRAPLINYVQFPIKITTFLMKEMRLR